MTETGIYDLSGNVQEWADDSAAHGGAYDDVPNNLACASTDRSINPTVSSPNVGFRCCFAAP